MASQNPLQIVALLGESETGGPLLAEELLLLGLAIEGRLGRLLAGEGRPSLLQLRVLALLAREGELEPRQVARTLNIHPASLHHTLQQLIHSGSMAQRAHPTDGRRRLLSLTDGGRRLYRVLREPIESDLRWLTSDLSTEHEEELRALIHAIRERLGVVPDESVYQRGYRGRPGP